MRRDIGVLNTKVYQSEMREAHQDPTQDHHLDHGSMWDPKRSRPSILALDPEPNRTPRMNGP